MNSRKGDFIFFNDYDKNKFEIKNTGEEIQSMSKLGFKKRVKKNIKLAGTTLL